MTGTESSTRDGTRASRRDAVAVFVFMAAALILTTLAVERRCSMSRARFTLPQEPQTLAGAALIGEPTASIGAILYTDFRCPYCRRFATQTWPSIKNQYVKTGLVRFAVRFLPNEHSREALDAARMATCADEQGLFWDAHDRLFAAQEFLSAALFLGGMDSVSLDEGRWRDCLTGRADRRLGEDRSSARAIQVDSTPFFLLGVIEDEAIRVRRHIDGAAPFGVFASEFEALQMKGKADGRLVKR